jgi:hypothetical protein
MVAPQVLHLGDLVLAALLVRVAAIGITSAGEGARPSSTSKNLGEG